MGEEQERERERVGERGAFEELGEVMWILWESLCLEGCFNVHFSHNSICGVD